MWISQTSITESRHDFLATFPRGLVVDVANLLTVHRVQYFVCNSEGVVCTLQGSIFQVALELGLLDSLRVGLFSHKMYVTGLGDSRPLARSKGGAPG